MASSIADLSWAELDRIGQDAGADVVARTLEAGLSTMGAISGTALQVKPDGSVHNLGLIEALDAAFILAAEDAQSEAEASAVSERTPSADGCARRTDSAPQAPDAGPAEASVRASEPASTAGTTKSPPGPN